MKNDILVTGGAGYIGSHTIVELYNSGYRPIIVDDLSNTSLSNIIGAEQIINDKITFYQFDCTDFEKINNIKIVYKIGPRRNGDVEKIYSDNRKINTDLGWYPSMSFESALESA